MLIIVRIMTTPTQVPQPAMPLSQQVSELENKYYELLYAVASKYPNETRHETALRYIRERELATNSGPESENVQ